MINCPEKNLNRLELENGIGVQTGMIRPTAWIITLVLLDFLSFTRTLILSNHQDANG
ncbi:hypothetical protein HanPI659440_Chr15g0589661 [Helianthus annuus]|nr:hypothetical protein HanPI659440_Chr15g0589661 [Helianthus annuus]